MKNTHADTANKDSSALDMMPILNLFNEWHAASTSKKYALLSKQIPKPGRTEPAALRMVMSKAIPRIGCRFPMSQRQAS